MCLMIFIAVANVVAITRRYYKLFTKNLVLYKYLSLDISGIRRATRRVLYRQVLQFYARKHVIISAKWRLVMRYFAFLETTKGFSRKNSSSPPQESCFEVEIGFSYWCRHFLRLIFGE